MLNRAGMARLKMSLSCREYISEPDFRSVTARMDSDPESATAQILQALLLPGLANAGRRLCWTADAFLLLAAAAWRQQRLPC